MRSQTAEQLAWPARERFQVDVKHLSDLAGYREPIPAGRLRYGFAARIAPESGIRLGRAR